MGEREELRPLIETTMKAGSGTSQDDNQKSKYNRHISASDILLAAGLHSSRKELNFKLANLLWPHTLTIFPPSGKSFLVVDAMAEAQDQLVRPVHQFWQLQGPRRERRHYRETSKSVSMT